jgi:hypothetical protein
MMAEKEKAQDDIHFFEPGFFQHLQAAENANHGVRTSSKFLRTKVPKPSLNDRQTEMKRDGRIRFGFLSA